MPKKIIRVKSHPRRIRRKKVFVRRHTRLIRTKAREGINLINPLKFRFGSVEWQDVMRNNIGEKLKHEEDLSDPEKTFLAIQHRHNIRNRLSKEPRVKMRNLGFRPKARKEIDKTIEALKFQGAETDPLFREAMFTLEKPESALEEMRIGTEHRKRLIDQDQELLTRMPEFYFTPKHIKKISSTLMEFKSESGAKAAVTSAMRRMNEAEEKIQSIKSSLLPSTNPERAKEVIDFYQRKMDMARNIIEKHAG